MREPEPTYLKLIDGQERALFGGHMRTREYIENWPFVDDDEKIENFKLDGYLPYPISPTLARIFKGRGITDTQHLRAIAGDSYDVFDVTLYIAHGAPEIDTSPAKEVAFYVALGLSAPQILEIFIESEQFHAEWERENQA